MEIPHYDWSRNHPTSGAIWTNLVEVWAALRNLHARVMLCERRIQRLAKNEDVIARKLGLRVEDEKEEKEDGEG